MHLYLAVGHSRKYVDVLKANNVENVLFSYQYIKSVEKWKHLSDGWFPDNLLIDSGAFSVWTGKAKINIDDYIYFCKDSISSLPDKQNVNFVNLDVLPGKFGTRPTPEQREDSAMNGLANFDYILSKGIKTIPVFHQHEDFKWLEAMMKRTDYIGISPANDVSGKEKDIWLRKVFAITRDKIKTHGFGITSLNSLLEFPFYSADSSSWTVGARFARIPIFDSNAGKFVSIPFKDKEQLSKLWSLVSNKTTDIFDKYEERIDMGCKAYIKANKFIDSVWQQRNITFNK